MGAIDAVDAMQSVWMDVITADAINADGAIDADASDADGSN